MMRAGSAHLIGTMILRRPCSWAMKTGRVVFIENTGGTVTNKMPVLKSLRIYPTEKSKSKIRVL